MIIFLDFDGVLHSAYAFQSTKMFSQLPIFENFFRQPEYEKIEFVISSTWRHGRSLTELRQLFAADIATRIIGKTPENVATTNIGSREQEIQHYLRDTGRENEKWLALDDVRSYFNDHTDQVYFCTAGTGLTEADLPRLAAMIHEFQAA